MSDAIPATGPLAGIKVLDLSRVLAGPWCSQVLGDLGAEVIKVERPGHGDDTRHWGPPFLGSTGDSAYFACANRNKRSVAIDMAQSDGARLIRELASQADIVIENFRVGALSKYGLDYESIRTIKPDIIYCSITGFGQDGPLKDNGGYDFLIQGMSGLMSVTGPPDGEPGGGPMKVGIPVSDLTTGLYATISILAALTHRNQSGEGQHIDIALLDSQIAILANQASNWLNGGMAPKRLGNQHPNTVPYQDFTCADGEILVALGNDRQFRAFCTLLGRPDLGDDPRFSASSGRSTDREALLADLSDSIKDWKVDELIEAMAAAGLPGGKVNEIPEALEHPQVKARKLLHQIERRDGSSVNFLGFPAKLAATPANYRRAPPQAGEDTLAVLQEELGLSPVDTERLLAQGVIAVASSQSELTGSGNS